MKRFEEQRQYNPSSTDYDLGNGPLTAPDIGSLIRQEFQRTRAQDQYAETVREQNQSVADANAKIKAEKSFQGDKSQTEYIYKSLIPFSNKLFDLAVGEFKGAQKREALKGQMDVLSLEDPSKFEGERLERYIEARDNALAQKVSQQEAAAAALKATQRLEIADMFRKGTPEYQFQLVASMLQLERDKFQNVLTTEVAREDKFLSLPGQEPIPYNQVTGEAATGALGHKIVADQLSSLGFEGINPMMMEDYFYGGKNGIRTQLAKWKRAKVNVDSVASANNTLQQQDYVAYQRMRDDKGSVLDFYHPRGTELKIVNNQLVTPSPADQWKSTTEKLVSIAKSGGFKSPAHIKAYFARSIDPVTNKPMDDPLARNGMMQKVINGYNDYIKEKVSLRNSNHNIDGMDAEDRGIDYMQKVEAERRKGSDNETTWEEYQQMQQAYMTAKNTDRPSLRLQRAYFLHTNGGKNMGIAGQKILERLETGQAGMEELNQMNVERHYRYDEFKELAQRNDKLLGPEKMKFIDNQALKITKGVAGIGPDAPETTASVDRVAAIIARRAKKRALKYILEGMETDLAMERALDEIVAHAETNQGFSPTETKGFLAPGQGNTFPNWKKDTLEGYKTGDAMLAAAQTKFEEDAEKYGTDYSKPGTFVSKEYLKAYRVDPIKGNFPPITNQMADAHPNMTRFEAYNYAMKREGLPEMPEPISMLRFRQSTQMPDEDFKRFLKDIDKAKTSYDITKAGYNANTGLQLWRAGGAEESIVKVAQESGLPEGAVLAYAHMSNQNFSHDYAKLSANIQQLSATAEQGGLTGEAREDYIFASLLGDPPQIVDGQLKLTDSQQVKLDNLTKNRASFADPAVMHSGSNLNPTYRKVSNNTLPGPTEYEIAAPGKTPEERAWLRTTRYAEGGKGYNIMFGGSTFQGTEHPRRINTAGGYSSDAAGAYQFLSTTWDDISKKLGLKGGITPANQDEASLGLMIEKGVDPKKGWSDKALYKLAPVWASFPKDKSDRSYYDQPSKTTAEMKKVYEHFLQQERQRDQQQNTMI